MSYVTDWQSYNKNSYLKVTWNLYSSALNVVSNKMVVPVVSIHRKYGNKYSGFKYKYKYRYPSLKYEYKYKYWDLEYIQVQVQVFQTCTRVHEYNSNTSTST